MRGQTLSSILRKYRSEARISTNAAHNVQNQESQVQLLQRTQERLWEEFDWPHLIVNRNYPLTTGEAFYDVSADFDISRVFRIYLKDGEVWRPLAPNLEDTAYSVWDTERDQTSWPVREWRLSEDEKIELWPTPDRSGDSTTLDGYIKVRGVRKLRSFVTDNDIADLDDVLITLYAAAETLAATGAKDAQQKLGLAQDRKNRLQGNMSKKRSYRLFQTDTTPVRRRPMITTYRPPE